MKGKRYIRLEAKFTIMSKDYPDIVLKASRQTDTSCRITFPWLGVEYYKRIVHDNGRVEFIPVDFIESTVGVANGDDK